MADGNECEQNRTHKKSRRTQTAPTAASADMTQKPDANQDRGND
jgi:hypothetical protein